MTALDREVVVAVCGRPAPKGSMRFIGKGRKPIDDNPNTGSWLALLVAGLTVHQAAGALPNNLPVDEPLLIDVTFTLARPAGVKPAKRPWPSKQSPGHGDVDKLARCVLDALQQAGVIANDSLVVELSARKCYPDTPGVADKLDRPGAVIRLLPASIGGE